MQSKKFKKLLAQIIIESKKTNKKSGFVFVTTTKKRPMDFILLPIRKTNDLVCGAVTVYELQIALEMAKQLDGKIDYVIIDAEQKLKHLTNLVEEISNIVSKSEILTFKGNDSTADAADTMINQLLAERQKKKIVIIGAGNIGSKIALKLVERGSDVYIARSSLTNAKKTANAINLLKPRYCKSIAKPKDSSNIAKDADVIIGFSRGIPVISKAMISQMKQNGLVLDGGLGTLHKNAVLLAHEKNIKIIRLDMRAGFAATMTLLLETKKLVNETMGSTKFGGVNIIAGGLYGKYGDAVVDSITKPTQFIGFSDGMGEIVWKYSSSQLKKKQKIVEKWIKGRLALKEV